MRDQFRYREYRRTSTFRDARAREFRQLVILLVSVALALPTLGYVAYRSSHPNLSQCQLLWGEGCHE